MAGGEALQLFDNWAGVLPETAAFTRWVIEPTRRIVGGLSLALSRSPVIGSLVGPLIFTKRYLTEPDVDAIGLDTMVPASYARERLQPSPTFNAISIPCCWLSGCQRPHRIRNDFRCQSSTWQASGAIEGSNTIR
jgi:uroporphyrinogen decarboxylase